MALPEVRQDPKSGAVAVDAGAGRWGVMHPQNGGHWAQVAEVVDWPAGTFPALDADPAPAE